MDENLPKGGVGGELGKRRSRTREGKGKPKGGVPGEGRHAEDRGGRGRASETRTVVCVESGGKRRTAEDAGGRERAEGWCGWRGAVSGGCRRARESRKVGVRPSYCQHDDSGGQSRGTRWRQGKRRPNVGSETAMESGEADEGERRAEGR
jgi:hypothetical protein